MLSATLQVWLNNTNYTHAKRHPIIYAIIITDISCKLGKRTSGQFFRTFERMCREVISCRFAQ